MQKLLQFVYLRLFQLDTAYSGVPQALLFQALGRLEYVRGAFHRMTFAGERHNLFCRGRAQSLIRGTADLSLQLSCPTIADSRFDFVKTTGGFMSIRIKI
jgi:hypothetical protein